MRVYVPETNSELRVTIGKDVECNEIKGLAKERYYRDVSCVQSLVKLHYPRRESFFNPRNTVHQ